MRTVAQHLAHALSLVEPLPAEVVAIGDADGRVLARALLAPQALPRWDGSAMDGYAVRAADLVGAAPDRPVTLTVVADLPAGSGAQPHVGPGTAARIMTGAPVPPGADAVVAVEQTDGGVALVRIDAAPEVGRHIRPAGGDLSLGDLVLADGTLLGPAQVAAAAAVGVGTVEVRRRPRVAVISTGDELVADGAPLQRGQIPDSNSLLLAAQVRSAGGLAQRIGPVPDDVEALRDVLDRLDGTVDLVVTSGGVSMGAWDVVKAALMSEPGMEFVQVAMQPGKPQGVGRLAGGTPLLALPGNPVSAFVSFEVFVRPVLRRLLGQPEPAQELGVVVEGWRPSPGRAQVMPVRLGPVDGVPGAVGIRPASSGGSGSHLVARLARADALALVDAGVEVVGPGDVVPFVRVPR